GGVAFLRSHLGRDRAARGGHRPGHGGAGSVARGGRAPDGGPDDRRGAAPRGPRGDRQRRYARRAAQARGGGVADPRTVRLVLAAALAARAAWGASPCEEGGAQTGLALAAREGGLEIAAVDAGSAAAESGLHAGDTLVQVNAALPRSCADYARAVRDAREGKKALLLLVRRSTGTVPLALGPATWERAVATAPPPPPPEAPSVRALVATPAPAPVAPEAHASLDELEGELRALAPADRTPGQLADYSHRLLRLHRQVEALAARHVTGAGVVDGLRTVLRYFDAAEVARAALGARARGARAAHVVARASGSVAGLIGAGCGRSCSGPRPRSGTSRTPSPCGAGLRCGRRVSRPGAARRQRRRRALHRRAW